MVEIALVGCAHIHTPGFVKKMKEQQDAGLLKVKSVWDHDEDRARKRAEELASVTVQNVGDIFVDPAIRAVVICSETNRHEDLVLPAAKARKHMFVEKPLGMDWRDGYKMAAAIEKAGVIFQTGYFMRGNPIHLFLREQIQKGTFGKITRIRGSNCHSGSLGGWFDTDWRWMADTAVAGVGAFGDLGTHLLDIMIWLMGDVASATATLDKGTARYGDCDETGEALMRFANGAIGTLAAAWVDVANPVTLLISGTEAHAAIINGKLYFQAKSVEGADGKQPWTALPEPKPAGFDAFLEAITGQGTPSLVSATEAAYRSAVMAAMYDGAAKNKWIAPRKPKA